MDLPHEKHRRTENDARDSQANRDDRLANDRDRAAETRDDEATERDLAALQDLREPPPLSGDQSTAADNRESAAQDRASAVEDRGRSRRDRKSAERQLDQADLALNVLEGAVNNYRQRLSRAEDYAEDMLLIGQAQGIMMVSQRMNAAEALRELYTLANRDAVGVPDAAKRVVDALGT